MGKKERKIRKSICLSPPFPLQPVRVRAECTTHVGMCVRVCMCVRVLRGEGCIGGNDVAAWVDLTKCLREWRYGLILIDQQLKGETIYTPDTGGRILHRLFSNGR